MGVKRGGTRSKNVLYNFEKYHTEFSTSSQSLVMKGLDEAKLNTFSSTLLGSGSIICFTDRKSVV